MKTFQPAHLYVAAGLFALASTARGADDGATTRSPPVSTRDTPYLEVPEGPGWCAKLASSGISVKPSLGGQVNVSLPPNVIEAESLLAAGKVKVNGGSLAVQPMAGFGPGWGGDAQLFWSGGAVGAVLDASIQVSQRGLYTVEMYLTRAPDYAQLQAQIKGATSGWLPAGVMDGWGPSVKPPAYSKVLGNFPLAQGDNNLSLMITGKNAQSSGYLVGIDCIALRFKHSM